MRALAAHCPSVAEAAALWGASGLPALAAHLRPGQAQVLREAAAAALDAILRLHKTAAVKEVLAKGMRIKGLLEQYGARALPHALLAGRMRSPLLGHCMHAHCADEPLCAASERPDGWTLCCT